MAVYNTLYFAVVSIPLAIIFAFGLALMLNAKIRGQVVYRTIYFLPTLGARSGAGVGLGLPLHAGNRHCQSALSAGWAFAVRAG